MAISIARCARLALSLKFKIELCTLSIPQNGFKRKLAAGHSQIGIWSTLPGSYAAEVIAGAGYDWMLIDTEHSPGDPLTVLSQLQAIAPYSTSPVVRPASNDKVLIKRFLDIGSQTLLIPFVQNADEAREAVSATRYPPAGERGISSLTRATRFGRATGYPSQASEEICVLVQVETPEALEHIPSIARVEGVDGIFIGPGDLATTLGYAGNPEHPEVVRRIEKAISIIRHAHEPSGILTSDIAFAKRCIDLGCLFTAVAVDVGILARGSEQILDSIKL